MKVSELENRLIDEVRTVLQVTAVSIEEVPRGQEAAIMSPHDTWIKIGEKQQPVYLRIAMEHPLLRIEEEWLETAVHYVTILYDNLHLIEDLMKRLEDLVTTNETPKWMLRLLFKLSEKRTILAIQRLARFGASGFNYLVSQAGIVTFYRSLREGSTS